MSRLGTPAEPTFAVRFAQSGTMPATLTPRRWDLIAALREAGPSSVRELAQRQGRDQENVLGDVAALEPWMAVQGLPDGRVHEPWREIVVDMRLPDRQAACRAGAGAREGHEPGCPRGRSRTRGPVQGPCHPPATPRALNFGSQIRSILLRRPPGLSPLGRGERILASAFDHQQHDSCTFHDE